MWKSFNFEKIDLIQDPVYESYIVSSDFINIYSPIFDFYEKKELKPSYFFISSPINNFMFEFRNNKVRERFRKKAEKLKLIPSLKEISVGDDERPKKEPTLDSKQSKEAKVKKQAKPKTTFINHDKIIIQLDKYLYLLQNEADPIMQDKYGNKIRKILKIMSNTV